MGLLSSEELKQLLPAETSAFPSPIPTQSVSSDEFMPAARIAFKDMWTGEDSRG
jgi:hypothetical protein